MNIKVRTISLLKEKFAISQLKVEEKIPYWAFEEPSSFFSIIKTEEEISIICLQEYVPKGILSSGGWSCLKLEGSSDLDEPGVLASLVSPLAEAGISVFAQATYNTDYLLVNHIEKSIEVLQSMNHIVLKEEILVKK